MSMKHPKINIVSKHNASSINVTAKRLLPKNSNLLIDLVENDILQTRLNDSALDGKAIYLDNDYDWVLVRDNDGSEDLCLVPLKKA